MEKLTNKEEEIMRVLWHLKKAFVKDVVAELPNPKPHYNTISTTIRNMEEKGFVHHEAFGKPIFIFRQSRKKSTEQNTCRRPFSITLKTPIRMWFPSLPRKRKLPSMS